MKKFYYIESVQTYINIGRIEAVYQANGWKVRMASGEEIGLTENEYWKLAEILRGAASPTPPYKPQND